jgi:hypothetical protein
MWAFVAITEEGDEQREAQPARDDGRNDGEQQDPAADQDLVVDPHWLRRDRRCDDQPPGGVLTWKNAW